LSIIDTLKFDPFIYIPYPIPPLPALGDPIMPAPPYPPLTPSIAFPLIIWMLETVSNMIA